MLWNWFQGKLVTFWQPITDPGEQWYRDEHVLAHAIGGVLWTLVLRLLAITWRGQVVVLFAASAGSRLAAVGLIQLTLWELIQHENWRPELMTPPRPANSGYPWLSVIWDVLFTLAGAALFELIVGALHAAGAF